MAKAIKCRLICTNSYGGWYQPVEFDSIRKAKAEGDRRKSKSLCKKYFIENVLPQA